MSKTVRTKTKLKPCPFCGGGACVKLFDGVYRVVCYRCESSIGSIGFFSGRGLRFTDAEDAAKAWNQRIEGESCSELKPCPFCGSRACFTPWRDEFSAKCVECGAQTPYFYYPKEAAETWNRREGHDLQRDD